MNILITGGAGFIGSNLSLALLSKGHKITVFDNLSPQIHGENAETTSPLFKSIKDKVNFIQGDVSNVQDWEIALFDQDIVVHFAAETGTGQSMYQINKYTDVNLVGTSLMLDLLSNNKNYNIKKIIIASSRSIYGEGKYKCSEHGNVYPSERIESDMLNGDFNVKCPFCFKNALVLATDEESKIHPSSFYGITKQVQEQMCLLIGKSIGIPVVAFRYQNVYGPGQSLSNPYTGILSIFSTRIKNNNNINVFEDGEETRDFVYIDDVVAATILGIEKEEANFKVFNVGSGKRTSVLEVAKTLKNNYRSEISINISGNFRLGDIRDNYADMQKIKETLGFTPRFTFEEGISNFTNWVENQDVKQDNFQKSIDEMKDRGLLK
jgi:dTDP-L-rhamnose 4-epimerase|tara:strand:- start:1046 stop:2182 length:1137 start_codon:yes stop_codon:yes gene_type:complete